MVENLISVVPVFVLISHIAFVILAASVILKNSFGRKVLNFVGEQVLVLAFIISLLVVLGSLFYSEIAGFEPCFLCWWQRVFLYPTVVIFSIALWRKLDSAFTYAVPLVLLALLVASIHSYADLGGGSILPCTAVGGACSKVYVKEFGYITIPTMSFTAAVYLLALAWVKRTYDKNRNA